jgi:hypothetical protein
MGSKFLRRRVVIGGNYTIFMRALVELAGDSQQELVGSHKAILEKVNTLRLEQGLLPISLSGLRSQHFYRAISDLGGTRFPHGPISIDKAKANEYRAAITGKPKPGASSVGGNTTTARRKRSAG